jgi:hypothetical protein
MNNRIISIVLAIIGAAMTVSINVVASNGDAPPGVSVYGTKAEQDAVYEAIQESENLSFLGSKGVTILGESIMPMYSASLYEYAETGVFTVRPSTGGIKDESIRRYMAKTVTAEGVFAGNMGILVRDGTARMNGFFPTSAVEGFERNSKGLSHSYADHARRVQSAIGRESFVPVGEVRYLAVDGLGTVFYVNDGKTEVLVNISAAGDVFSENREIIYVGEELKKIADHRLAARKAILAYLEAMETDDSDSAKGRTGYEVTPGAFAARDRVDNIINIVEYLGLKDSDVYFTGNADTIVSPPPESTAKEDTTAENATVESGTADNRETDSMESDSAIEESITTESTTAESTAENTATANAGAANTAATGAIATDTNANLVWLWLLALPLAAVAVFMGIRLIRKGKKPETPDSNSNDN